jgi:1-deoxy-D-xylulose-5-phosphate synthase
MLFEELGFAYLGVIDGHDLKAVREALRQAFETERPVVVHARTIKGKGYEPAEESPDKYHGTGPFFLGNGERKETATEAGAVEAGAAAEAGAALAGGSVEIQDAAAPAAPAARPVTYTHAFGEALVRLAETDERIVAITAAMTQGTGLDAFEQQYPERFYDVGIAEEHAAVFAAGLALGGLKPVVAVYSTFLQRSFDMLIQDVALQELPVVFAVDRAGLVGDDGPTHHGAFDLSYLRLIPGMTVMAPSSHLELQRMLATALTLDGPAALRYPRGMATSFARPDTLEVVEVGRGEVLAEGADVALVGIGTGVGMAVEAATRLRSRGIDPTVVDARFVKPLDRELLARLAATHRLLVTIEENVLPGGFGSAVLEEVAESGVEVRRFGLPDAFVPHGERRRLLAQAGLTAEAVATTVVERLAAGAAKASRTAPPNVGTVKAGAGIRAANELAIKGKTAKTRGNGRKAAAAGAGRTSAAGSGPTRGNGRKAAAAGAGQTSAAEAGQTSAAEAGQKTAAEKAAAAKTAAEDAAAERTVADVTLEGDPAELAPPD